MVHRDKNIGRLFSFQQQNCLTLTRTHPMFRCCFIPHLLPRPLYSPLATIQPCFLLLPISQIALILFKRCPNMYLNLLTCLFHSLMPVPSLFVRENFKLWTSNFHSILNELSGFHWLFLLHNLYIFLANDHWLITLFSTGKLLLMNSTYLDMAAILSEEVVFAFISSLRPFHFQTQSIHFYRKINSGYRYLQKT